MEQIEKILRKDWNPNFNKHNPQDFKKYKITVNDNVAQDLELFISYDHQNESSILNRIDNTYTSLGHQYLRLLLETPIDNVDLLKGRQKIIQNIENLDSDKIQTIKLLLQRVKESEEKALEYWKAESEELQKIHENLYFENRFLKFLNKNEWFLKIYYYFVIILSPLYGAIGPVLFLLAPFFIIKFIFGIPMTFSVYYSLIKGTFYNYGGIFEMLGGRWGIGKPLRFLSNIGWYILYLYGIYNSYQLSKSYHNNINLIHKKVNHLAKFVTSIDQIVTLTCQDIFETDAKNYLSAFPELYESVFKDEASLLSDKGKILKTNWLIKSKKARLECLMQYLATFDAYFALSELKKEGYVYSSYLTGRNRPALDVKQLWNPYLNPENAIRNNLQLGVYKPNNCLITGPNTGGKSTFIKAISLGAYFSHTLGIVSAKDFKITPLKMINTYLNIPDIKGKESLFEAEMERAWGQITQFKQMKGFGLVVMDEIFNSTNYYEGVSGAYVIGKELGTIKNGMSLITTHFNYLTKLEKTKRYVNYKFEVIKDGDKISRPYLIKPGISKQLLALDLLEKKGFDKRMVVEARKISSHLINLEKRGGQKHIRKAREAERESQLADSDGSNDIKIEYEVFKSPWIKEEIYHELKKRPKRSLRIQPPSKPLAREEIIEKIQKAVEEKVDSKMKSGE